MSVKNVSYRSLVIFLSALFLLLLIAGFFVFFSGCQQQSPPPVSKTQPPSAAEAPQQQPGGHFHADGTWHAGPHEADAPQPPVKNTPETQPEDLTPIPWEEATQRLLARRAAVAKKPPVIAAETWEGRKRQVAADPDVIWQPRFIVPDGGEMKYPILYDYDLTYEVDIPKNTESQRERLEPLQSDWRNNDDPEEDKRLRREIVAIEGEGLDPLTAVKYIKSGLHEDEIAVEYAERAVRENPTAEAYHVLAWIQDDLGDDDAAEASLRRALSIDPNYLPALDYLMGFAGTAESIGIYLKLCQLDPRFPKNTSDIAFRYARLGHFEKALEIYQSLPKLNMRTERVYIEYLQDGDLNDLVIMFGPLAAPGAPSGN